MPKVDEELSRRFHGAERPVETEGVFEGLARRRSRRRTLQRVQAGALAVAVLAATAAGFVALQRAFERDRRDVGSLSGNGEIAFIRDGEEGGLHLYAAQPDGSGLRQVTEGDTNDSDPTVSPDGRTVAFARGIGLGRATIATVPIEGGPIAWQTREHYDVTDPAWSPDGSRIAFIGHTEEAAAELYVAEVGGDAVRQVPLTATEAAHPTWSPDGTRIALAAYPQADPSTSADLAVIRADGNGGLEWLVTTTDADEQAPAWSPDGSRVAFLRDGQEGHEVWTMSAVGGPETLVATAVEATLLLDLDWAPDGSSLLVSDGDHVYRVDATPQGDPRDNFVQLMRGFSPSWQPIPAGSEPSVTTSPEPSMSPSPEPEGRDIGLGFNLCNVERLAEIDFLGDGTQGIAWTGARVKENGDCPELSLGERYLVAADVDGDGSADTFSETLQHCFFCRPFDATDLDADGSAELVVLHSEGSTPSFMIFGVNDGAIAPLEVAAPGHPEARIRPSAPLSFATGGDEGFAGWVGCEGLRGELVLVIRWRDHPIEGDTQEVHETGLVLREDRFHVVRTSDYSLPAGSPVPGASNEPACGVDWQI